MIRPLLAALAATLAITAAPLRAAEVSTFTLDNGLEAVVIEDHRAPVVVHMVWYRVGAADEPPGRSGIAHFLEHLMFKGSENFPAGVFSRIVKANGGSDNAFTSWDYTAYFQRIAADRLDLVMEMEADRMRGLEMTEDDATTERGVILEERNQRIDSDVGAQFGEQRSAAQYLNHPYGRPIIGWRHEVEGLTHADALDFYRRYYAPNNAVLIVAGDVRPDEVRRLAEARYGPLAPTPDLAPRLRPQEPPQRAERRLVLSDPRVGNPYLVRTYLAPERDSGDQRAAAALEVLAEVLGGEPATSVLGADLQFERKMAVQTSAFYDGMSLDDTTFGVFVVPTPGVSLTAAEAALDAVIADFLETGIDPEQLARIKARMRASDIYDRDSTQRLARRYGAALTSGLTVADVEEWPELLQQITADEVMAAAATLFDRRNAVTAMLTRPDAPVAPEATQ
ncbi:MAG: insulinase family protein [Rhodobacteraceae bacterium]|nr:insulinase family protein [Paracoccaceae bacterium]